MPYGWEKMAAYRRVYDLIWQAINHLRLVLPSSRNQLRCPVRSTYEYGTISYASGVFMYVCVKLVG